MIIPSCFYTFLCGSHAMGWAIVARRAREERFVDLCQFVRSFIFAPFIFAFAILVIAGGYYFTKDILIPNALHIVLGLSVVVGTVLILTALGYFAVAPAIKKAYGIAKPFSEKICIVMYKQK